MCKYEYKEKTSSVKWWMEVRKDSSCKGNIRKNPFTGRYQFYRGAANVTRPSLEEASLEALIAQIEELDI
jgi:hypothetical protein